MIYLSLGLFFAVTLALLSIRLLDPKPSDSKKAIRARFKERFEALEIDLTEGRVETEQADKLRADLEAQLVSDYELLEQSSNTTLMRPKLQTLLLIAGLSVAASGVAYFVSDNHLRYDLIQQGQNLGPDNHVVYISNLQDWLKSNPDDLSSNYQLAQLLHQIGRFEDAEGYYRQALRLLLEVAPDDALNRSGLLTSLAEARLAYFGFDSEVEEWLLDATRLDARNMNAMAMLGINYYEQDNNEQAFDFLKRLHALLPAGDNRSALSELLYQISVELGENWALNPSIEPGGGNSIQSRIDLTIEGEQLPTTGALFVLTRMPGSPIPVAVKRLALPQKTPIKVSVSEVDDMGMAGSLADLSEVELVLIYAPTGALGGEGEKRSDAIVTELNTQLSLPFP